MEIGFRVFKQVGIWDKKHKKNKRKTQNIITKNIASRDGKKFFRCYPIFISLVCESVERQYSMNLRFSQVRILQFFKSRQDPSYKQKVI